MILVFYTFAETFDGLDIILSVVEIQVSTDHIVAIWSNTPSIGISLTIDLTIGATLTLNMR